MPNWLASMQQTFEFYVVDPGTWQDRTPLRFVKSCTINRDSTVETLGSATLDIAESIKECYVRVYLVTVQNGITERFPLGTFLVQTSSSSFDGKSHSISADAYTPLLELKENAPPIGYSILKGDNIMECAYLRARESARAPVVRTTSDNKLELDFVAETNDTWLSFISDLISNAKYQFELDEMGRILFAPKQTLAALHPIWTYNDDNSSILYSDVSVSKDLYGIPNVVEVIYSKGVTCYHKKLVNDDSDSPVSTVARGREIIYRVTNPEGLGTPSSQAQVDEYAALLLKELSSIEYTVTYTHGYCPVRLGDCVRLNYSRAGLTDVKAKVISQSIKCEPGCPVTEKAIFTASLWSGGGTL